MIGYLHGSVGDRVGVVGGYGVPGENARSGRIRGLCASTGMSVANAYFQHKDVHKHTWYRQRIRGRQGVSGKKDDE